MPRFDYTRARNEGLTDEEIFAHLEDAQKNGITLTLDKNEVEAYRTGVPLAGEKPDMREKIEAWAATPFATTGRTVGRLILGTYENTLELIKGQTIEEMGRKRVGFDPFGQLFGRPGSAPSLGEIPLTALELAPGVPGAKAVVPFLKKKAAEQFARVLGPTTQVAKQVTERVVPGLLERGVVAPSQAKLAGRVAGEVETAGAAIGEAIEKLPTEATMRTKPILDALEAAKQGTIVTEGGKQIIAEPGFVKAAEDLQGIVSEFGENVSAGSLIKLRRIWDTTIARSRKGFAPLEEATTIDLKRSATKAIREEFAKEFPDVAKLNAEYSFWKSVDGVLSATATRRAGQAKPIGQRIAKGAGFIGGAATGGIMRGFAMAEALSLVSKVASSTAWATVSAVAKTKLANAIISGRADNIFLILGKSIALKHNLLKEKE